MGLTAVRVMAGIAIAGSAAAQSSGVVDDASFTFTRGGQPYGTESFKIIRRLGAEGVEFFAQCTRAIEGRVIRTALVADSSGNPASYTRATTGAGQGQLTARRAMNRLTVNEEGARASSRDYVFGPGSLILDDDVIHQLYFVTWGEPRRIGFVAPGAQRSGQGELTEVGRESVTIGNAAIPATHYSFGEGNDRREIWVDSDRRLLKVMQPARQVVGLRSAPPR